MKLLFQARCWLMNKIERTSFFSKLKKEFMFALDLRALKDPILSLRRKVVIRLMP